MKISNWSSYSIQNFFSSLRGKATLPDINYTDTKNIQSGLYKKLLKKHFANYDAEGNKEVPKTSGEFIDEQI